MGGGLTAAIRGVPIVRHGREDPRAGRAEMHARRAGIPFSRARVDLGRGGHGDHIREVGGCRTVARRVERRLVVVTGRIARRGDDQDADRRRLDERGAQRLRWTGRAPADGEHAKVDPGPPRGDRIVEHAHRVGELHRPVVGHAPERHQADLPVHARDADAVIADRADRPGDLRPVPRTGIVCVQRLAADVRADRLIAVGAGRAPWERPVRRRGPHVVLEIAMAIIDPAIDDADDDALVADRMVPGGGCPDRGETPEAGIGVAGVVGNARGVIAIVGLGITDARHRRVGPRLLAERSTGATRHHPRVDPRESRERDATLRAHDPIARRLIDLRGEAEHELPADDIGRRDRCGGGGMIPITKTHSKHTMRADHIASPLSFDHRGCSRFCGAGHHTCDTRPILRRAPRPKRRYRCEIGGSGEGGSREPRSQGDPGGTRTSGVGSFPGERSWGATRAVAPRPRSRTPWRIRGDPGNQNRRRTTVPARNLPGRQ
jgi:hypothetical protein